jgi:hypothetical protein
VVADIYPPYFTPPGDPGGEGVGEKLPTRSTAKSGPQPLARKVDWLLRKVDWLLRKVDWLLRKVDWLLRKVDWLLRKVDWLLRSCIKYLDYYF